MSEQGDRPEPGRALPKPLAYAAKSKEGIALALEDARAARLHPPAAGEHARRLMFGLTAPFTLLRLAWRHAPTRGSMLHRLTTPIVLMAAALCAGVYGMVGDVVHAHRDPAAAASEIAADEDDDDDDDDEAKKAARRAREERAAKAGDEALKAAERAREQGQSVLAIASAAALAASAEAQRQAIATRFVPLAKPAPTGRAEALRIIGRVVTSRFAKIFAALGLLEWILVWIFREHQDAIAVKLAELTGAASEPLESPPRHRFDFGWLKLKAWRAIRFLLFMAVGSPAAWLLGAIPYAGAMLAAAWQLAWAAYWACVFAIANSHLAWEPTPDGYAPWFLRPIRRAARVPIVGLPFRLYGAILTKTTRAVFPACAAFEVAPWEAAGLALARLVASVPGTYLVCRPMFPPAATHALAARRASVEQPTAPQ